MRIAVKNILVIPPFNPFPLESGGHQAIFNGIAVLKDEYNVYLITPVTESQYKRGLHNAILKELPFVHVIPFVFPETKHTLGWFWKVFQNKLTVYARKLHVCSSDQKNSTTAVQTHQELTITDWIGDTYEEEIALVQESIKRCHIDIVQCEMIPTLTLCDYIPSTVLKIFVHHELRYVRNELLLQQHPEASHELKAKVREDREKEIRYLNRYDTVITLSEIDCRKLEQAGVNTKICTSFAVVRGIPQLIAPVESEKRIIFIGPEFHAPNHEGVMWFLNNCWTKIRAIDAAYRFDIIGNWSEDTARTLTSRYEGVACLGFVDDLQTATRGATMIVPVFVGSGIRMKILESAQWGMPIVTTTVGAEGLPLKDRKHVMIADTPDAFVKAIIAFDDLAKRQSCTNAILEEVLPRYTIAALKENRLKCYEA